jgi:anaerobic selenocysteine-containing dehydrogenase
LTLIKHKDRRVHLDVPEILEELRSLSAEVSLGAEYPFILAAGERRTYNANQIYRNPSWRKLDPLGAMRIHPLDAAALDLTDGAKARCTSMRGSIEVDVQIDDSVRRGMVILPHGYGMRYRDSDPIGPEVNRLTWSTHCDRLTLTPFHKYVPVRLSRIDTPATRVPC